MSGADDGVSPRGRCGWVRATRCTSPTTTRSGACRFTTTSALFEMLMLEGAQAGLSWITILRKRENYRRAFDGFDPAKVARLRRTEGRARCWPIPASSATA